MKRILVLSPHADDEVLGVGGYLLHQRDKGADIYIVIAVIGGPDKLQNFEERRKEFCAVCDRLNVKERMYLFQGLDAHLDIVPSYSVISEIDKIIDRIRPDEIFINYSSHHQDHKKLYSCAMASLRLRDGYSPKLVALYEYPFIGGHSDFINGGRWYHDISDVIDDKIDMFYLYKSQVRKSPSPLNEEGIRSLAKIRGVESGVEYAEMFYVQKLMK